ncbi:MAG: tetratricopeptide repeat protein [Nostoc sp.]|uniref:CHAT domain-containing protein n=1 Tax=Nostoc sp. TaxID=1180 RepID=UPI002FFA963F
MSLSSTLPLLVNAQTIPEVNNFQQPRLQENLQQYKQSPFGPPGSTRLEPPKPTIQERNAEVFQQYKVGVRQLNKGQFRQALETFQHVLGIYRKIGDRQGEGLSLTGMAVVYHSLGEYPKALELYQQTLAIYKKINYKEGQSQTFNNLGAVYYSLNQYTLALKFHQQALTIRKQIDDKVGQVQTFNNIGGVHHKLNQYAKALEFYQQALAICKQVRNKEWEGRTLNDIGEVYLDLGEYAKALEFYQQALTIRQQINNQVEQGQTLNGIGIVYYNLGQYTKALEFYEPALAIHKQINDKVGEAESLNGIAAVYQSLAQYALSLEFFGQALAIRQQIDDQAGQGRTLTGIGLVYDNLGQYAKALEFFEQALAISKQINDKAGEGTTLDNIGGAYLSLGQYPQASNYYTQALAIHKQINNKAKQGGTINKIGFVYNRLGKHAKALEFFQQALAIHKQINDKARIGESLNGIAEVHHSLGEYPKALEFYQQALNIFKEIGLKVEVAITLTNIGRDNNVLSKYADAEKTLFDAIKVWEELRPGLQDNQKISIFETQAHTYRLLQQALVAQNKTNTALEIAERGRAKAFIELLASKLSPKSNHQPNITQPKIQELQKIATQQKATLVEYSIIYDPLKQGKKESCESKLFIWVIKPTGEVAFRTTDLKSLWEKENISLEDLVNNSREIIGIRDRGIFSVEVKVDAASEKKPLQQLYELMISPIADLLPQNPDSHVIFIPQSSLFLVPFPALQDKNEKYLIEKHTILTAPAIQVLDLTHKQQDSVPKSATDVLIAGNPTMPSVSIPITSQPQKLPPLPNAEKEAVEIARLFDTRALIGKNATKDAILQQMPKARLIHLATHGLLDDLDNLGVPGAIALAPSGQDNGLLRADEILDLKLNASLVVLSACDTGQGNITGDGVIGLSRSLIIAGARSVLVSLWTVPDDSTSQLMIEFYRQLQQNPDKAEALRQAMLNTMKQHPNPKDWAAFTLIGEAD